MKFHVLADFCAKSVLCLCVSGPLAELQSMLHVRARDHLRVEFQSEDVKRSSDTVITAYRKAEPTRNALISDAIRYSSYAYA